MLSYFLYKKSPERAKTLFLPFPPSVEKISHKDPIYWDDHNYQEHKHNTKTYPQHFYGHQNNSKIKK